MSHTDTTLCITAKARRKELTKRINAAMFFYIALPSHGSATSIILGRRVQCSKNGDFMDELHTVGYKNPLVDQYLRRIKEVNDSCTRTTSPTPSTSESPASSKFILHANPEMYKHVQKHLAICNIRFKKQQAEQEDGEIPQLRPLVNAQPVAQHAIRSAHKTSNKENFHDSNEKAHTPKVTALSIRIQVPPTPVQVSTTICLSTSRVVTMVDIINILCPSYILPATIPWTTDITKLLPHKSELKHMRKALRTKFANEQALDVELETIGNIKEIFNTQHIPCLPPNVRKVLSRVEEMIYREGQLDNAQTKVRALQKVILSLNEGRTSDEMSSVLAPIEHEKNDTQDPRSPF